MNSSMPSNTFESRNEINSRFVQKCNEVISNI